jgi:formyl-CoA transferase/succinyl-CoA--D-citramalate CoA-transferase
MTPQGAEGAAAGLRVIELGHLIAGPFCTRLFADHGADVIKVEPPTGDPMREWGALHHGVGLHWHYIARGKRSVRIDLRTPSGRARLLELALTADVLVENFRPGTLERWGLGWDELHAANPRLVLVRVSGFGQTGPYRDRAGFGLIGEAMSGFRHLCGEPGRPPVRVGISLGDTLAGIYGFIGALLALRARDRTGQGQVVDVALYEAMWSSMESLIAEYETLGISRGATGSILPGIAPSNVYPTADDHWIAIGANQDSVFRRLAEAMGRNDWLESGQFATHLERAETQAELDTEIAAWTRSMHVEDLLHTLEAASVPAGRIYTAEDIAADEQYAARDMILRVPQPTLGGEEIPMPGVVPKLSLTPGSVRRGAPFLGEHEEEILGRAFGARTGDRLRAS